ncbi:hypothetical protein [Streptomyces sp. NPDC091212]|uniref:hypothetical protein n=1 Tax=Streptomyces sp. NPDC091212 TaxID=3155191 RepID=UPI00341BBF8A
MSDENDNRTEHLMEHLANYAEGITTALLTLPIPIELPHGHGLVEEFLPAVIRAYDIMDEQPIPRMQQVIARAALLHWITGAELILSYVVTGKTHRADGALINLLTGEQILADLIEWLVDPEGGEAPDED